MSTNFYAKRIPTQEQLDFIASLVKEGNLTEAQFNLDSFREVHLGKRSSEYNFLFNHNDYNWKNTEDYFNWIKSLSIRDTHGNAYSFEEFMEEVHSNSGKKQTPDSFLLDSYHFAKSQYFC